MNDEPHFRKFMKLNYGFTLGAGYN